MINKKTFVIIFLAIFVFFSGCKRSLEPITTYETEKKVHEDIAKIEKIKKDNKSWEENLDIDLYTAIALAIKNNKELKVKLLETAMSNRQIDKVRFEMLPSFAANAGYTGSERYNASASATVPSSDLAGSIGSSYSTSRERDINSQDIGFTWNALDFGLSYIRAGQDSNRYLISEEMERKAEHNITREVIKFYWNTLSADKLIKKYDPLLIEVDKALNDSQKIEELLLTKPMDALLYQKELLDIQRALQTQKQMFIDSRIQLATLMGLLPNQKFKVVETKDPLTILDMSIKGMEEYALIHRPELKKSHYDEAISIQETKASMTSLLPGLNFNAAWTHSSNDHLMNKTNFEYGSVMGANLLNVFMYPKIKEINQMNTEIIKEKRLALSMAVLSQVHLANIDYSLALEEYDTAQRYYQVSKKITEQIKNAQKIARFGNLELIREQASLLVAELRHDLAYTKLQYAVGEIYTSVGIDITKENIKELSFKDYASLIKKNFNSSGKKYYAKLRKPIKNQNPVAQKKEGSRSSQFSFSDKTFDLEGEGRTIYDALLSNNQPLPTWISFLPSQKTFLINNLEKDNTEELEIKVIAKNINTRIEDTFTLLVDPELRITRLKNEKRLKEQRKLAKKRKQEEIQRLKAEKILKEKKAKEEAILLAKQQEEEKLKKQQEKILLEKKAKEEAILLAKQQEEEKLKKQQEKILLKEKKKEELIAKQQEVEELRIIEQKKKEELIAKQQEVEELRIIEQKKKEELIAKQKAEELRIIEQKKKEELMAKQKAEEFRANNSIKMKEILMAQREQLYFKLSGHLPDTQPINIANRNNLDEYLLNELKTIETKINDIMLNLDLDERMALTKAIIKDYFKSNPNKEKQINSRDYEGLNYQINNQRLFLEKLLEFSGKYN